MSVLSKISHLECSSGWRGVNKCLIFFISSCWRSRSPGYIADGQRVIIDWSQNNELIKLSHQPHGINIQVDWVEIEKFVLSNSDYGRYLFGILTCFHQNSSSVMLFGKFNSICILEEAPFNFREDWKVSNRILFVVKVSLVKFY